MSAKYKASKYLAGVRAVERRSTGLSGRHVSSEVEDPARDSGPVVRPARPIPDTYSIERMGREMKAYDEAFEEARLMSYIMGGRRRRSHIDKDKK